MQIRAGVGNYSESFAHRSQVQSYYVAQSIKELFVGRYRTRPPEQRPAVRIYKHAPVFTPRSSVNVARLARHLVKPPAVCHIAEVEGVRLVHTNIGAAVVDVVLDASSDGSTAALAHLANAGSSLRFAHSPHSSC